MRQRLGAALSTCLLAGVAGEDVPTTYSGYLVDTYCYGLCKAKPSPTCALDSTNVITDPWRHTIHCLRDPSQCYADFFLAELRGDTGYHPKFRLGQEGTKKAFEMMLASFPVGHPKDYVHGNYTVRATGTHNGDGYLRDVTLEECDHNTCDSVCEGNCEAPDGKISLSPPPLIWAHAICMLLSWGLLLPSGVLCALTFRGVKNTLGGLPLWFAGHRGLQMLGWLLQLLGFVCIFLHKSQGGLARHFHAVHEQLGLVVVVLGTLQPFNAQLRHLKCVGHPGHPGPYRKQWEWLHKGLGYAATTLGLVNVVLGLLYGQALSFGDGLIAFAMTWILLVYSLLACWGTARVVRPSLFQAEQGAPQGSGAPTMETPENQPPIGKQN